MKSQWLPVMLPSNLEQACNALNATSTARLQLGSVLIFP